MELWIDTAKSAYGLEAEPSYEPTDAKAVSFTLDKDMQLEIPTANAASTGNTTGIETLTGTASVSPLRSNHSNLPAIRFLPDGSISETSPLMLRLIGREGDSLWIAQSRSRLAYEIRTANN